MQQLITKKGYQNLNNK